VTTNWRTFFDRAERAHAEFLLDGEATYAAMKAAIRKADSNDHYVYILGWMLQDDFALTADSPETLFELLKDVASKGKPGDKGVEIRGLIWDNPLHEEDTEKAIGRLNKLKNTQFFKDPHTFYREESNRYLQNVTRTTIVILLAYFPRLALVLKQGWPKYWELLNRPWGTVRNLGAHHEKVVIVKGRDGLVGFCGGLDFSSTRVIKKTKNPGPRFPGYHDAACKVDGRAAFELLKKFVLRWDNHPGARSMKLLGATEPQPAPAPPLPSAPPPAPPIAYAPYVQVIGTYNPPRGRHGTIGPMPRDRSARKAYFDIIENAESYIYIEDQYLVNLDIAKRLNKKIREPKFEYLTIVIQQASETTDMLIPNRKRAEFINTVYGDAPNSARQKVTVCVIDKARWEHERYHPGLHAKVLIADDTIAIIGSPNINRRSLTLDSETAVVLFDEKLFPWSFARRFRQATWKEYSKRKDLPFTYELPWALPRGVGKGHYIVTKYTGGDMEDLDVVMKVLLEATSVYTRLLDIDALFEGLWEHAIDPWADD
jgi:phosphatidylserine/phosphatidylglycerophosphate/cardiolipin synthase-like enzyme